MNELLDLRAISNVLPPVLKHANKVHDDETGDPVVALARLQGFVAKHMGYEYEN